ncbi:MAG: (Fe-S)-binding protein [Candidatus Hatepunaea meridiana]|nr:(Fe-S)-binding protein [Candidatus Hatepunaea meridiana]
MTGKQKLPEVSLRTEELDKCVNCGMCQAVCPTFIVKGHEGLTARGKIELLKRLLNNTLEPSKSIADLFDDCLTCYACQSVCQAGVKTERLWTASRQDLGKYSTTGRIKHLGLNWTVGKPKLFNLEVGLFGILAGFNRNNPASARLGKYSLPIYCGAPYLKHLHNDYPPMGKEVGSVGLLLGCSVNLSTPWVADAVILLLNAAGWRVIIPKDQVCCGAPAINNACWDIAKRLAKNNLKVFNKLGVDRITSSDATCAGAFKYDYKELFFNDDEVLPVVSKFADMTVDLSTLLSEAYDDDRIEFDAYKAVVTLHDSCHVTNVGGGSRWLELLSAIDELEIKELKDSEHCCGFGGSYAFFHNDTSFKIAERKMQRVVESGAEQVLVGSPGCLLRLQSVVNNNFDRDIKVRHVSELLAEAIINK